MDNREAKFILSAYRPDGQDAADPRFGEALEQARRDPMLETWFRDAVAFDVAVTRKLHTIHPPAELRDNIFAGARLSQRACRHRRYGRLAIAAGLMFATAIGALIVHETARPRLAGWQSEALDTISSLVAGRTKFDVKSRRSSELGFWLQTHHALAALRLPRNLTTLESLGCKTFSWHGATVSVICFTRADGGLIHLAVMNQSAAADRPRNGQPELVQRGNWATATWREGDMIYMLALEGSREELQSCLS